MMISCAFYKLISVILFPPACSSPNYLDNFKLPSGSQIISRFLNDYLKAYDTVAIHYEDIEDEFLTSHEKVALLLINTFKYRHSLYLTKNKMNAVFFQNEKVINIFVCNENDLTKDDFRKTVSRSEISTVVVSIAEDFKCNVNLVRQFYDSNFVSSRIILVQYCLFDKWGSFRYVYKYNDKYNKIGNLEEVFKIFEVDKDLMENYGSFLEDEKPKIVSEQGSNFTLLKLFNNEIIDINYFNKYQLDENDNSIEDFLFNKKQDAVLLRDIKQSANIQKYNFVFTYPVNIRHCKGFYKFEKCHKQLQYFDIVFFIFMLGLGFLFKIISIIIWSLEVIVYSKILDPTVDFTWFNLNVFTLYSVLLRQRVKTKYSSAIQMFYIGSTFLTVIFLYQYFYSSLLKISKNKIKMTMKDSDCILNPVISLDSPQLSKKNETELTFVLRKHNPYIESTNNQIMHLVEAGLIDKAVKDSCSKQPLNKWLIKSKFRGNKIQFTLSDYKDTFLVLFSGLFMAGIVFVHQIVTTKFEYLM